MGWGAAPGPRRSAPRLLLLVITFLLCISRILTNVCPHYCTCNVTMQLFHHVICERASLDSVPRQLPSKSNTTFLSMEGNRITTLRESDLDDFKELQALVLDHNKLTTIDIKAFHRCPRLKLLRLAHNNLRSLDSELFKRNTELQYLDLSYNKLILQSKQPFLKSRSLMFLNLTASEIREIPVIAFSEMPNIGQLELNNNLLTKVNVKTLDVFVNKSVTVLMTGNPLHCDCEMKLTWEWMQKRVPVHSSMVGLSEPLHLPLCNLPPDLRERSWAEVRHLDCRASTGHGTASGTIALYVIAGLLVVIAALVALVWWGIRRRRRHNAAGQGGGAGGRRKHRLAPPVGEYIDVLGDSPPTKEPIYDALRDPGKDPSGKVPPGKDPELDDRRDGDKQRYVARNTYLAPVRLHDDGPIYVNMKGPPLPLRRPSDVPPPPSEPAPLAPSADGAKGAQSRPCSIPLLEGCDFYEVVD